jgi:ribonuclease P protein component
VLPKDARLTSSSDFARTTKSGSRATTDHFVGYLYINPAVNQSDEKVSPKAGLVISKAMGNSVQRHRLARRVRHAIAPNLSTLPANSLLVIRALKQGESFNSDEITRLIKKVTERALKNKVIA